MELPLPFRERMKQMLGDEYGEFLESYDRERSQGLAFVHNIIAGPIF